MQAKIAIFTGVMVLSVFALANLPTEGYAITGFVAATAAITATALFGISVWNVAPLKIDEVQEAKRNDPESISDVQFSIDSANYMAEICRRLSAEAYKISAIHAFDERRLVVTVDDIRDAISVIVVSKPEFLDFEKEEE